MKKHGIRLGLSALLLAIVFSFSSCSGWLLQILRGWEETYHAEVNFSTLEYKRPDADTIAKKADELTAALDTASLNSILNSYNSIVEAFSQMRDMQTLLNIRLNLAPEDADLQEESLWMAKATAKVAGAFSRLNYAILQGEHGETLFGSISDKEKDLIRRQALAMDEEYAQNAEAIQTLVNAYNKLEVSLTVTAGERSYTLEDLRAYQGEDREALMEQFYRKLNQEAGEIYLALIPLYKKEAEKFGYSSVQKYAYEILFLRSYTEADAQKLYAFAKENIPAYREALDAILAEGAGTPAKEANTLKKNEGALLAYFKELDAHMDASAAYSYMLRCGVSSIGSGGERVPAAFTTFFPYRSFPYLFLTTTDSYTDFSSFVHEFGHFYAFYHHGQRTDLDLMESQSQTGEFLFAPYFSEIYGEEAGRTIQIKHLRTSLTNISLGCLMDEFQAKTFSEEFTSVSELNAAFLALAEEYGIADGKYIGPVETLWSLIPHNFETPFYYISYATSLIPTLQIAALASTDREEALKAYADLIHKDNGTHTISSLCEEIGLFTPFSEGAYAKIDSYIKAVANVKKK